MRKEPDERRRATRKKVAAGWKRLQVGDASHCAALFRHAHAGSRRCVASGRKWLVFKAGISRGKCATGAL